MAKDDSIIKRPITKRDAVVLMEAAGLSGYGQINQDRLRGIVSARHRRDELLHQEMDISREPEMVFFRYLYATGQLNDSRRGGLKTWVRELVGEIEALVNSSGDPDSLEFKLGRADLLATGFTEAQAYRIMEIKATYRQECVEAPKILPNPDKN